MPLYLQPNISPCGGIGRRSRLKICHSQGCEGSIPFVGTENALTIKLKRFSFQKILP